MYVCISWPMSLSLLHCILLLMWSQLWATRTTNHWWFTEETINSEVIGVLFWVNAMLLFVYVNPFLISLSCFLVKVNCLIWSPPGHRGPSPRAKPLCHTSYGKFLRGHAAPRPPHDRHRALQTASPLLLGEATLWAWLQVGVVLTPLVSWLMK